MLNGTINFLKPPGITSQEAVSRIKRLLGVRKAGHAGTLDPGACGVLVVCVGRATKMVSYIMGEAKEYVAELVLGTATDTLDSYGTVTGHGCPRRSLAEVQKVLSEFTGTVQQRVPAYSAVKVGGRPLYAYARHGREIERPERVINVHELEILKHPQEGVFRFRVRCSKGSYVRVLLTDIALRLGTCGYVSFLERTACGERIVQEAVTLSEMEQAVHAGNQTSFLCRPEESVSFPRLEFPLYLHAVLQSGAAIDLQRVAGAAPKEGRPYRVFCGDEFFGIGESVGNQLRLTARVRI